MNNLDLNNLIPNFTNTPIQTRESSNFASAFAERLTKMINEFDEDLDETQEVGIRLVSFGQTVQLHVDDIGYYNPSLIRFFGSTDDNKPLELIQHVSQINFLLMAVDRLNPNEPKKRIGFSKDEASE